jgi:murein DD-endopeptidase MepM/ murein hydrolase activator NlpD
MRVIVWVVLALTLASGHPSAQPGVTQPPLSISVRGEPAQPGGVLAVTLTTTEDVEQLSGDAFGQRVQFVRGDSPRVWHGLIGVDLSATGPSSLVVLGTTRPLAFEPRQFPTRRLRVATQFVEPSPAELERIRAEAERLEAIFGTVTIPDRIEPFAPPLPGVPGSNFGSRSIFNGEPRAPHAGVDFRGAVGTPIAAPGAGRVVLAEPLFFTGNTVVIDHGLGLYSLLAHLSQIEVAPGVHVARGGLVGLLGATGRVTGPHLHWTVRLGGARVDPLRLLALLAPAQSGAPARPRPTAPAK